jgi:chromosome segregation ATPase
VGTPSQDVEQKKAPGAWQTVADKIAAIAQENFSGIGTYLNQEYDFKITKVESHAAQEFEVKVFKKGETTELCTITTSSDSPDAIKFRAKAQDIWDALFNPSFTVSGSSSSGALAHAGKAGASSPLPGLTGFSGEGSGRVGSAGAKESAAASLAASGATLEFGTIEGDLLKRHEAIASLRGIRPSDIPGDLYVRDDGILGTLERDGFIDGMLYRNESDGQYYYYPIFAGGRGEFIDNLRSRDQTDPLRLEFTNRNLDFWLLQDIKVQLEPRSATDSTPRNLRAALVSIDLLQEPIRSQLLNVLGLDPTEDYRGMGTSEQETAIRTALFRFPNPSAQIIPIVNMRMESLRSETALKATQLMQQETIATLQAREAAILAKIAELTSNPQADPLLDAGLFPVGDQAHKPIQTLALKLRCLHASLAGIEARPARSLSISSFESDLAATEGNIAEVDSILAALSLSGASAHAEPEAESRLAALQAELDGAREALAGAEATKVAAIRDALSAQEAQHATTLAALTERQEALSAQIEALRGQLTTADARAQAAARAKIEELEAQLAALDDPIAQLRAAQEELVRLRAALTDSQARLAAITGDGGELPRAQAELEGLGRDLAAAKAKARTAGDEAAAKVQAEIEVLRATIAEGEARFAALSEKLALLLAENEALKGQLADQTARADAATISADEALRAELAREKAEVRRLEAAIVQADERAAGAEASARASVTEEVAGLRAELDAAAARVRELSDATSRAGRAEAEILQLTGEGGPIKAAEKAARDAAIRVQELEERLAELTRLQQQKALAAIQALTGNLDRTLEGIPEEFLGAFNALANFSLARIQAQQALGALEAARDAGRDSTDFETAFDAALRELEASTGFLAAIDAEKDPQVKALIQYALFSTGSDRMAEAQEARIRALTIELGSTRAQLQAVTRERDALVPALAVEKAAKEEALAANLGLRAEVETLTQDKARLAASLQAIALQVGFIEEGSSLALDEATLGTLTGHIATRLAGAELEATTAARAAEEASGKSAGLEEALRRAQARLEALSAAEEERAAAAGTLREVQAQLLALQAKEAKRAAAIESLTASPLDFDVDAIPEDLADIRALAEVVQTTCSDLQEELDAAEAQKRLAQARAAGAEKELAALQQAQEGAIAAGIAKAYGTINASLAPLYGRLTGQELGAITPANLRAQLTRLEEGMASALKKRGEDTHTAYDKTLETEIRRMCASWGWGFVPSALEPTAERPLPLGLLFEQLGTYVTAKTSGLLETNRVLTAQCTALTDALEGLTAEYARLEKNLALSQARVVAAEKAAREASARAAAFEASVGEASASAQAATAAKSAAEKRALAAERALEDARITIGAADVGVAKGTAKIRDLTSALDTARAEVASKEHERAAAVSRAGAAEYELGRLRAEAGKAGLTQGAFIAENRRLREELAAAQEEAAAARGLAAEKQRLLNAESAKTLGLTDEARRVDAAHKAELARISAINDSLSGELRALQAREAGRASAAASAVATVDEVELGYIRAFVAKAAVEIHKMPNNPSYPLDGGVDRAIFERLVSFAAKGGSSAIYRMTKEQLYPYMDLIGRVLERLANAEISHGRAEATVERARAVASGGGASSVGKSSRGGFLGGLSRMFSSASSAEVPPPAAEEAPNAASGGATTGKALLSAGGGVTSSPVGASGPRAHVHVVHPGSSPATVLRPLEGGSLGTPGLGLTVSALNPLTAARSPAVVSAAGGSTRAPLAARGAHSSAAEVLRAHPAAASAALEAHPLAVPSGDLAGVVDAGRSAGAALAETVRLAAGVRHVDEATLGSSALKAGGGLRTFNPEASYRNLLGRGFNPGQARKTGIDTGELTLTGGADLAAKAAEASRAATFGHTPPPPPGHPPGKGGLGGGGTPGRL